MLGMRLHVQLDIFRERQLYSYVCAHDCTCMVVMISSMSFCMEELLFISLVPRLPHSGTQTLKLCRQEESGTFPHMSNVKGTKGVERP